MMTRAELNRLRILRAEIESGIRELRGFEKKERSTAQHGQSLLRSLKRIDPANGMDVAKTDLIHTITDNQLKYLAKRAEMEDKISSIPDHYVRVVLSLVYVDGLTTREAAAVIHGSCTGSGISQLLVRYFKGSESP